MSARKFHDNPHPVVAEFFSAWTNMVDQLTLGLVLLFLEPLPIMERLFNNFNLYINIYRYGE